MQGLWTLISFVLIFTVIVVSHEFGHFIIARINGIKVYEFTIGFGPAIFKKKGKNTTFAIRLLPFGGACIYNDPSEDMEKQEIEEMLEAADAEVALEDTEQAEKTEAGEEILEIAEQPDYSDGIPFSKAPVWARISTIFAGPLFNIILAFLLSIFLCWFCGSDEPVVGGFIPGYPAENSGIEVGDTITKLNGLNVYLWREVSLQSLLCDGRDLKIEYMRDGQKYETVITPIYIQEEERFYYGIKPGYVYVQCNDITVIKYAYFEVRFWVEATFKSLARIFRGQVSLDDFAGPVGVAEVIDDTIQETKEYGTFTVILNMINIAVLLSVNLAILNLLPFPALDGGRLLILLIVAITRKEIPEEKEGIFHLIGMVILVIFMLAVLFNDFFRLFR